MRHSLFRSFLVILLFWWWIGLITFSLIDPAVNLQILQRLQDSGFAWFVQYMPESASALNAWRIQWEILRAWTAPMLVLSSIFMLAGYGVAWATAYGTKHSRDCQAKGHGAFRGLGCTLGITPAPVLPKRADITLKAKGRLGKAIADMPKPALDLMREVLEVIAGNPDTYVGDGHGEITLLEHTLNNLRLSTEIEEPDPLLPVVLAAHDLGKITAFIKRGDAWVSVRDHDKESARIMALLESWWAMPVEDREIVRLSVKYTHSLWDLPKDTPNGDRILALIDQSKKIDGTATANEKQDVLDNTPLPEVIFNTFTEVLATLPFHALNHPAGVRASGWRNGNRVYLLEFAVRNACMAKMGKHVVAALGGTGRNKKQLAMFTKELLEVLDEKGWLVKAVGKYKTSVNQALWHIIAGKKEFEAVLIIDLPDEQLSRLPKGDSPYEISVKRAQFMLESEMPESSISLLGLLRQADPASTDGAEKPTASHRHPASAPKKAEIPESVLKPAVQRALNQAVDKAAKPAGVVDVKAEPTKPVTPAAPEKKAQPASVPGDNPFDEAAPKREAPPKKAVSSDKPKVKPLSINPGNPFSMKGLIKDRATAPKAEVRTDKAKKPVTPPKPAESQKKS